MPQGGIRFHVMRPCPRQKNAHIECAGLLRSAAFDADYRSRESCLDSLPPAACAMPPKIPGCRSSCRIQKRHLPTIPRTTAFAPSGGVRARFRDPNEPFSPGESVAWNAGYRAGLRGIPTDRLGGVVAGEPALRPLVERFGIRADALASRAGREASARAPGDRVLRLRGSAVLSPTARTAAKSLGLSLNASSMSATPRSRLPRSIEIAPRAS